MKDFQYIETEFSTLLEKISDLAIHKDRAKDIYDREFKRIHEYHAQLPDWSDQRETGHWYYFRFTSPSTGEETTYQSKTLMLADQVELNELQKLKTYHWLLAEAYEAFGDFVERAYAYCGVTRNSIWLEPKDWKHGKSADINHYLNPRRKGKDTPDKQLKRLRLCSKHFATHEVKRGKNLRVILALIEKIRHITAHKGGYSEYFEELKSDITRQLSDMNTKNLNEYIDSYFMTHKGNKLIDLLEFPVEHGVGARIGAYHDSMTEFFRALMAYAQLVKESIKLEEQTVTDLQASHRTNALEE
ncbi:MULTISPECIES: hypothetical protein [unclassified Pseudomonas]|uniref:hypothetical protein n=1 Tax=unclassified Pseudomonas TaxID=196821 RepID=UPI0039B723C1